MGIPHIGNDANGWSGNVTQPLNFTKAAHSHLHNQRITVIGRINHSDGNPDVIIQ